MHIQKQFLTVWNFLLGIVLVTLAIFLSGVYGNLRSNWHSIYLVMVAVAAFFAALVPSLRRVAIMDLIIGVILLIAPLVAGVIIESESLLWWLPEATGFTPKNMSYDVIMAFVFLILYIYGKVQLSRQGEENVIDSFEP